MIEIWERAQVLEEPLVQNRLHKRVSLEGEYVLGSCALGLLHKDLHGKATLDCANPSWEIQEKFGLTVAAQAVIAHNFDRWPDPKSGLEDTIRFVREAKEIDGAA